MAAILGLADEVVEGLCRKIANVWPANYNCPGQIVISGEDDAVGECCVEAEEAGARRADSAARVRRVPLAARRAGRRAAPPAVEQDPLRGPALGVHVDRDGEARGRGPLRELLVEQLTAPVKFTQAARELIGKGVTMFVEVGPGNVLSGLLKRIDRSVRTVSVSNMQELRELEETLA